MNNINIIGAGLTGPLLSIYLAKQDFAISLFEKRTDCRISSEYNGRSINLALSERGINSLKEVSLYESIKNIMIPMKGRMIHSINGKLDFQPYGNNKNEYIYSVSRLELNKKLLDCAESLGVKVNFSQNLAGYDLKRNLLDFGLDIIENTAISIGCDGINSAIGKEISKDTPNSRKTENLECSYKEFNIPQKNNKFQLDSNALHIWPRKSFMMIALPNTDKSFTCTLFLPNKGKNSFKENKTNYEIENFFSHNFPDIIQLMPDYINQYKSNPVSSLATVYMDKWYYKSKVCVLGDAAHAIVPFFGQGMNAGFEDCSVFNKLIYKFDGDWEIFFRLFQESRKENCDAIAKMALENFIEMRDGVLDAKYLLKKKISYVLENQYHKRFIPRYSMVSFHTIPYKNVYQIGKAQDKILDILIARGFTEKNIDFKLADRLITKQLDPLNV